MKDIKQVIVVRKDLQMRKGQLATYVAEASMKFLIDNNESIRGDEFSIKLSPEEAVWLNEGSTKVIVGINSEDALGDLLFKAELEGIDFYPVIVQNKIDFDGDRTIACVAFGPASSDDLSKVIGKLKHI